MINDDQKLVIAKYIERTYKDPSALVRLEGFLAAFDMGWQEGIDHAAYYVKRWHEPMDRYHEGIVKGLFEEVEGGIRDLVFGDV
jgi:hypothetical protein